MELKRWLITGGCGFIGTSLIRSLMAEKGHFIRVMDNLSVGTAADLAGVCRFAETEAPVVSDADAVSGAVQLVKGDIRDAAVCDACCRGIDIVVHLAANTGVGPSVEDPRGDMEANVMGTFNMLEAARRHGAGRFIFASSGAPVGECEPPVHEELAPHPVSPYGASKLAGEGYCSAYYRTFGLETVALRFGNVYGPGSGHKNSVVAKFIRRALNGETLEIYGDGRQTRDFIYIDDLIRAVRLSADTEQIGGEVFQIATNAETTVAEMTDLLISRLSEAGSPDVHIHHGVSRAGEVLRNFSDTAKAEKMLGWRAETALSEGLKRTVQWFVRLDN